MDWLLKSKNLFRQSNWLILTTNKVLKRLKFAA